VKAGFLIVSQVLGGIAAAGIVSILFPGPLAVRTTLNENTSVMRGAVIEMFLTAELIFCIFMLAAEKHKATFLAPIAIGLALFVSILAGKCTQLLMFTMANMRRWLVYWWLPQPCALARSRCHLGNI
jgi:aquaporin related protein